MIEIEYMEWVIESIWHAIKEHAQTLKVDESTINKHIIEIPINHLQFTDEKPPGEVIDCRFKHR